MCCSNITIVLAGMPSTTFDCAPTNSVNVTVPTPTYFQCMASATYFAAYTIGSAAVAVLAQLL